MNLKKELSYIKQDFRNIWLKARFLYFRIFGTNKKDIDLKLYKMTFFDDFRYQKELDLTKWRISPAWGRVHPEEFGKPHATYWGEKSIELDNTLKLKVLKENIQYNYLGATYNIPFIGSWISTWSNFEQKYGYFECSCKLPKTGSWAGFWLSGWRSWPPEIDVFEYWNSSDKKVKSGIVAGKNGDVIDNGHKIFFPRRGWLKVGKNILQNEFNRYAIEWTENYVRFYFNDILYHEVTQLVDWMNEKMIIILDNHACTKTYNNVGDGSVFEIEYVTAYTKDY